MSTLKEILEKDGNKARITADANRLVEDEVASKGGVSGMAIKTAFKAVKKIKPGFIQEVIGALLPRFVNKLEPFYKAWDEGGRSGSFSAHLIARKGEVANALLSVTDERARQTTHRTVKKSYNALRPQGEKQVKAAVPGLGRIMDRYV